MNTKKSKKLTKEVKELHELCGTNQCPRHAMIVRILESKVRDCELIDQLFRSILCD